MARPTGQAVSCAGMKVEIENQDVDGDLRVDRPMWFAGKVSGTITVVAGGEFNLLGGCEGNLIVEKDGHALVAGTVAGEAINRGGTLLVHGEIIKGVRTEAGNTDVSAREGRELIPAMDDEGYFPVGAEMFEVRVDLRVQEPVPTVHSFRICGVNGREGRIMIFVDPLDAPSSPIPIRFLSSGDVRDEMYRTFEELRAHYDDAAARN